MFTISRDARSDAVEVALLDRATLPRLERSWDALLEQNATRSFFLSWDWIDEWLARWGEEFEPLFLEARRGDETCGIAPLVVRRSPELRLEFVGQNRAYGEYLDFLVLRGQEDRVVPELARAILGLHRKERWRSLCLATMLEGSPSLAVLERELGSAGLPVRRSPPRTCRYVDLSSGWDAYLALKGGHFDKRIRYNARRLERLGEVRFERAATADEVDDYFEDLLELHGRRWATPPDARFFEFLRAVARRTISKDRLLLARLRLAGKVVAVKCDFLYAGRAWGYQGGWRPDLRDLELGNVLIARLLEACAHDGIALYDFLEGDSWYKRHWSTTELRAVDLVCGTERPAYIFDAG